MKMSGLVSNKNKQTVAFLYPRFRYQYRPMRTFMECGFSVGSLSRRMFGLQHALSNKL